MTSDSDLKNLVSSQDLKYLFEQDPSFGAIVNDSMGILEDATLPEHYNEVPSNEDYKGPFNFDTDIDPRGTKNVMFSEKLNKVFVISHSNIKVDFKWDNPTDKIDFYVRAMLLYSSAQDAHKPVAACLHHRIVDAQCQTELSKLHVLRCLNDHAQYTGGPDRHLSVLVPLGVPQAGMETVGHTYYFVCKNSCVAGINRRAIDVVFTLEDVQGSIYGRKKVSVRICSCPKRDKVKEEEEYLKHRGQPVPRGKRRRVVTNKSSFSDPSDTETYPITMQIVGKRNAKAVIKYAYALMATEVLERGHEEPFEACYNELGNMLRNHN